MYADIRQDVRVDRRKCPNETKSPLFVARRLRAYEWKTTPIFCAEPTQYST